MPTAERQYNAYDVLVARVLSWLLVPILMPWSAYTFWSLYLWFAVPIGAPAIGFWHCCGLLLLYLWFRKRADPIGETDKERYKAICALSGKSIGFGMLNGFLLALGYLAHLMMGSN